MKKNSKDLNILFICGSYPPIACGVGDYTYNLVKNMAEKVNKISVLCSKEACCDSGISNVEVLNIVDRWAGISLIKTVFSVIKKNNIDLIHIQYPSSKYQKGIINNSLPFILRICGKKVVYTLHEYSQTSTLYKLSKIPAVLFSNSIIVVDEEFLNEIDIKYPTCRKKLEFVNIASNIPKSNFGEEELESLRKEIFKFNSTADHIISYFGFVTPNKCMELVLKSLKDMKDKGMLHSIFMIIGKFKLEDAYQADVYKLIDEYGLTDYVYITGYVESAQVGGYLAASDAALLLYDKGLSPRNGAFLAAQQENIKVFATQSDKIKGFLSEIDNVSLIENKMESIEEAIDSIQKEKTRDKVLNKPSKGLFEWSSVVDKHLRIYDSFVSKM